MRALLYFLIGFALQFVLWLPAYAIPVNAGGSIYEVTLLEGYWEYRTTVDGDFWGISCDTPYYKGGSTEVGTLCDGTVGTKVSGKLSRYTRKEGSTTDCYLSQWKRSNTLDGRYCTVGYYIDSSENGVQDGDEDGIDCGGSTGVECVSSCPDGYIPYGDNSCVATAPNPYPEGTPYPNGEISDGEPWVKPLLQAEQLQHAPGYTPTPDDWTYNTGTQLVSDNDTITYDKDGDYIIRDENGNIVEAKITGDYVSQTDNDDGTTTTITQDKIYKDGETTTTSTTTTVTDNATGDVVTQYTTDTKTTGSLIAAGKGSDTNLTGDQFSSGVSAVIDAINGDNDGDDITWSDPGDPAGVDYEGNGLDQSEYDWRSYIDGYVNDNSNFGWLSVIADSAIQTSNPYCSISGDVSIGNTTVPLTLSLCEYESTFQTMGAWLALLCQLTALIITFGGLD